MVPSPTASQVQAALAAFLASVLPPGTSVVEGQDNRVPEPASPNFVVMTAIRQAPLEKSTDSFRDATFVGSIAGPILTVTAILTGSVGLNAVFGTGVMVGTVVTALAGGTGGVGTYTVSPPQQAPSQPMAAGTVTITAPVEVTYQLDVHAASPTLARDMAQVIAATFFDDYGFQFFAGQLAGVSPLHAGEPRQAPFVNAEGQYETRWVVEAVLQANQAVSGLPQQFAASLTLTTRDVQ